MSTKEKFRRTFSKMHADPNTLEEVLKKAERNDTSENAFDKIVSVPSGTHKRKRKKFPAAAAVLIAAALGSTAVFAAVHSSFFQNALGTGISNETVYRTAAGDITTNGEPATISGTINTESGPVPYSYTFPSYRRVAVDQKLAEKLIGNSVETLNKSVTVGKWTYSVGDYVFDKNGNGIVSVTISNPDGIKAWKDAYESGDETGTSCNFSDGSTAGLSDHGETIVEGSWTDTSVDVIYYIVNHKTGFAPQTITMQVYAHDTDDPTLSDPDAEFYPEEASLSIPVTRLAETKEYTGENFTMSVSPIGCMITYTGSNVGNLSEYIEEEFVIHYKDGSSYTVLSDSSNESNENGGAMDESGHTWLAFNRLADTTQISEISFSADVIDRDGNDAQLSSTLK